LDLFIIFVPKLNIKYKEKNLKKIDFEKALAKKLNVSVTEAGNIMETVVNTIVEEVKEDGTVPFGKIGKFKYMDVKERSGVMNGVEWTKPAHKTIKFTLSTFGKEL
jgi:nucleoid DNA-binding protein